MRLVELYGVVDEVLNFREESSPKDVFDVSGQKWLDGVYIKDHVSDDGSDTLAPVFECYELQEFT